MTCTLSPILTPTLPPHTPHWPSLHAPQNKLLPRLNHIHFLAALPSLLKIRSSPLPKRHPLHRKRENRSDNPSRYSNPRVARE
jgi:hypothetical protein